MENNMENTENAEMIKNFIYAVADNNAVEMEQTFNTIMSSKIIASLDAKRQEIAASMFNTPEQE